ncbi:MAG TPA: response regulator transcription factor [Candidatus Polarisedimenticolaceae bacterium]|nr:response regulator transcription factor [Candidatus Polarisedimenticolaceae bacterium]
MREGVRLLLEREGYRVLAEASDGREACRLAEELHPDVALLDVSMPVLNGIDAARTLRERCPAVRTIALTVHDDHGHVLDALRAGFSGYVLKSQAAKELVTAIEQVHAGQVYLGPAPSRLLLEAYREGRPSPTDPLTPREREVLQLLAEGHATREIASVLGTSIKTVESHRVHIQRKLGLQEPAALTRYAIRQGIIEP